ncbi:hypothetical protein LWM68_19065 [Niabella sp. W65]|nr:hypothetical protein [Niabella sp. W65]MCH7364673.1 hypothetical protein [Niabella sp. W65]ULT40528.1 hypothetical protein KRR40_37965 [Niabella sp. I65]
MRADPIYPLSWRRSGAIEVATDLSRTFKIDRTTGNIRLLLSDQLEEYPLGIYNSIEEAKRKAAEKDWNCRRTTGSGNYLLSSSFTLINYKTHNIL